MAEKASKLHKMKAALQPSGRDNLFRETKSREEPAGESPAAQKPAAGGVLKGDRFTEKVTFPMTPEQKQFLYEIAEDFQRKRTSKQEPINRNTVLRCLVEVLRDATFEESDRANTEQELLQIFKKKLGQ